MRRHPLRPCALVWTLALSAWPGAAVARAQVIDRVLAVVDRQVVTRSDVRAALDLGLVAATDEAAAAASLVDRALVLAEVARYAPPEPAAGAIDEQVAGIRARLGAQAFEAALRRSGLDVPRLRTLVRQDLLIQSYLSQRFSVTAMPTDEQVEEYYRERRRTFVDGAGVELDMAAALPIARERLTAERRARLIAEWIADLRRRAQIEIRPIRP